MKRWGRARTAASRYKTAAAATGVGGCCAAGWNSLAERQGEWQERWTFESCVAESISAVPKHCKVRASRQLQHRSQVVETQNPGITAVFEVCRLESPPATAAQRANHRLSLR